jgi:anti-sigma B factor antagonist
MPTADETGAHVGGAEVTADATGVPIIKLTGEIDLSNADSVRAAIESAVANAPERIVFDLSDLDFLDSSGIALLLYVAAKTGSVQIRNPSDIVRRIIEVTGLSGLLHMDA